MIELTGVELGSRLRIVGDITAEVVDIVNDEWVRVRLVESPKAVPRRAPKNSATPPTSSRSSKHAADRLPARRDDNPMVLETPGEIEDLRLLAGVLRRFARQPVDQRLDEQGFCATVHTAITLTASPVC